MPDINAERDHAANAYAILGILFKHAPNSDAQAKVSRLFTEAQQLGAHGAELEMEVSGWLTDGLRDGKWPWNL